MTTLCYHAGVLAYDSRITAGNLIQSDTAQKCQVHNGLRFVLCGTVSEWPAFMQAYCSGEGGAGLGVSAFVLHPDGLRRAASDSDGVWSVPVLWDDVSTLGSGGDHAMTAVDCGRTPREAIKLAAKRDSGTGGKIRTIKLKPW